jgi:hypothetical protein
VKRIALLCLVFLGLMLGVSAQAADNGVINLKSGAQFRFKDIHCFTRTTTYPYITCFTPGKYEVAVSKDSVIVVRASDGRVLYHTPFK